MQFIEVCASIGKDMAKEPFSSVARMGHLLPFKLKLNLIHNKPGNYSARNDLLIF